MSGWVARCAGEIWVTPQSSLLDDCGWERFSGPWPKSGQLHDGHVYELPMLEPPTVENAGSVLPTPTARDWKDGQYCPNVETNGLLGRTVWELLPTPTAGNPNDGEDLGSWEERRQRNLAKGYNGNGQGVPLAIAVQKLLPTPKKSDGDRGGDWRRYQGPQSQGGRRSNLIDAADGLAKGITEPVLTPGASSGQRSDGGPESLDDVHQLLLWMDD